MRSIRLSAVATAALAAIMAAAALLSGASPAFASPVPPVPNPALFGTWVNTNPDPTAVIVQDITVSQSAGGLLVDTIRAECKPCDDGNIPATVYGATITSGTGNSFQVNYSHNDFSGPANEVLLGTLTTPGGKPTLTVQEFATVLTQGFGQSLYNAAYTETFTPAAPIVPQGNGTAATNYPEGNWVPPAPSLFTTWHSNTPGDGGLAAIAIMHSSTGPLSVHVFGTCFPSPCDWGVVDGTTYGATELTATPGMTFLAFYKFGFSNTLVSGTISGDGSTLTVWTYVEFTDESHRSNIVLNETFNHG